MTKSLVFVACWMRVLAGRQQADEMMITKTDQAEASLPHLQVRGFTKYPGYTGRISVSGKMEIRNVGKSMSQSVSWSLAGLERACFNSDRVENEPNGCGVHVHVGSSCAESGGHYWNEKVVNPDPWQIVRYKTDRRGNSRVKM